MAREKCLLTAVLARAAVHYDPNTGAFSRISGAGNQRAGAIASSPNGDGYLRIMVAGSRVLCHRLAFLWMTGEWPSGVVDHINGNPSDNRWSNLRDVSPSVNAQNQVRGKRGSETGLLGVSIFQGRPRASIGLLGRQVHLGTFDTPEAAHKAYLEAKRRLHEGCTI